MEKNKRGDKNEGKKEFSISPAKDWGMGAVSGSADSWDNMKEEE